MDNIFSQSFLRLYTLKILEMTLGRNKLSAKYRSADRYLAAFQSLTMLTEILHCVQDDGWKAVRCVGMKAKVFELH